MIPLDGMTPTSPAWFANVFCRTARRRGARGRVRSRRRWLKWGMNKASLRRMISKSMRQVWASSEWRYHRHLVRKKALTKPPCTAKIEPPLWGTGLPDKIMRLQAAKDMIKRRLVRFP